MNATIHAVQPDRIITLEGGQNFREIGGYPTRDGRRLKRGLLWRSAKLDELTGEDVDIIRSLGIATIADLRQRSEREQSPTHEAIVTQARVLAWDVPVARDEQRIRGLLEPDASPSEYFAAVLDLYRLIPEEHTLHLRELYLAAARGETPILIHCAAGKDRTGIAVAFLLELLGVERDYLMADYAKTEQLLDWKRLKQSAAAGAGLAHEWLNRMNPAALELVFRSDPAYLTAALEDIAARYGSVEQFAVDRLEIAPASITAMRDHLLETT